MWITQRFRTIAVFPINWERLDAGVFTSMLPATKRKSRTFATRKTDVISERKHCSRRRRHTQVELSSSRKCADKTQTIARKRWHGARKRKRSNVRLTCGRPNMDVNTLASKRSQLIGSTAIVRKRCVIHKKSTCVCLRLSVAAFTRKRRDARFELRGRLNCKYLGHCINDKLIDDDDMARQRKQIYAQGNALVRKFYMCTETVRMSV